MKKIKVAVLISFIITLSFYLPFGKEIKVLAFPFYKLDGECFCERATFSTYYGNSTKERKINIELASKFLNDAFIDVNAEFSFNYTVGDRTSKRGFKSAKIIINGEFVDGVGGGVCQVSTTLYNAVLLAGLKITEYHPHSLSVNYVLPSFDAMVSSKTADLRFVNNTKNPIIIKTLADGEKLTVIIIGEKTQYLYKRQSLTIEKIPFETEKIIDDGKYPELLIGQEKIIKYGKNGLKSKGYLLKYKGDKLIEKKLIRNDVYKCIKEVVIIGQGEGKENLLDIIE